MKVSFDVFSPFAYDLDVRKLIEKVTVALAIHHRESIKAGKHPSGGELPKLDPNSVDGSFGPRKKNTFFMKSGEANERWWLGKIRGTSTKASRIIKTPTPISEKGIPIPWVINAWLNRKVPIDLMSIDGAASEVIKKAIAAWLEEAVGEGVATKKEIAGEQTTLDKLK